MLLEKAKGDSFASNCHPASAPAARLRIYSKGNVESGGIALYPLILIESLVKVESIELFVIPLFHFLRSQTIGWH